ncbi:MULTISPECIES: glutathione S-transferase family protein [Roseobacteraceae]|uniref:glutathione S-transferase family protein n=1 Tax=Roseobacteraceae TaxID=2854170 RepID=UPI001C4704AD|nr:MULTISPECIES: glutathione S-transferase C-terminal domain-containing protein [Roseobacteraceae]MBV7408954.1 glutathione S-transferase C-terminal domain-containing protein [Maritimibacter sp. DP1N21-5]MBY5934359.1 glutathione S-transferase C-terminal domain-containing protein [Tateyamaria omphalii]
MGVMIDGVYEAEDPGPGSTKNGAYERAKSTLRHWITPDGPFTPDPGRYHLFVAWNCPWAHRTLLVRAILGLQDAISISIAKPRRTDQGWTFDTDGAFADPELQATALHEVYARQRPTYTGRITVPVLWDKHTEQIVSNESADIVRMLGTTFDPARRLCPPEHEAEIDRWNTLIHTKINNGVYRAGFARTQEAYDNAVTDLFKTLDDLGSHLTDHTTLTGDTLTEADLRLFPTLARFDVAYHYAFKCNLAKLSDYPALWDYARALYALPGIAATVKPDIYKAGYFSPSELRNPLGIVPAGPKVDWTHPPRRTIQLPD